MRQAAEKVRRRNTDKISDAVVITPFSSLEPVTSAGLDVSVGTGGAVGTAFLLSMSHVVLMCYLFHVHIVYAPGCNKTGGVGREFYSLYVGDEEELLVVCDRGALQAQASDSSRYRIASRPYTCLLEYVNLSADIGPDAQTHLQQGYLQDVSVRLECLLCSSYAVLSKLSSLGSSGTSSFSPPPGPVGTKGGVKLLSAASPYSVWGTYLRRSGNSDDNYAQESRVNSLNMARNALDFVTSISSLVVDALFAPVSAGSKPATPTGCLPPTFYTYRKAVTFESWVMLLAKILTFLSGVAVTPPPSTSFGSPTAGKAIINNQQKSLIGCEGDNGFMLNDIENFPTGFKLSASANTPGVGSLSGSSPTKPYVNYEVKSIYSILLCSLDIGNRYRRTDQGSLYGQDGAASAEESADCRCEVCRSILQANVEVSLQTVLLLRVKYAFQAGVGGDDSLPLSKFTDDYLELVSKLRLRYAHLCVPGVSQQVCVCSSSEAGMRPSTPGKGRGGSAVVKDGLSPLVKTKVTTTGSGDGGNVLAARSTRSDEQLSQEVDLQGQLREIDRQIQESIGGDREGSGSVAPKQVPLQSQEPTVQSAGGARVWQNLSPLQLDEPSDTPSVSDVAAPAKPAGTPTGQYLKETISSQLKMRNKEDGGAEDTGDNSSTSNTSVSPKPKSPTRIPRFSAPKSPPRSTSPPVPALRARADGDRRDAWPTEREQNSVQSESKDLSSNKSKASPSRSVTPAPSHPGSGSKPPSSRTPAYYIETPSSFSVISVDSEGRLVKGQNSALSSSGVSKQSSDSDEEGDTWRDVGGSSSEEDDYDPAVDAGLTSFCDDIVYNISPPRNQLSPTSLQKSSPSQYTEVSTGRGGSGTGGGSSTINSSDGSRRRLTSVATMSSRRSSLDRPPDEKRNFLRRTSTSVGFGGSGEATGGVSRSLFGSGRGIKEDLALKEAASRARIPSLELYASPVTGSVLLKTHPHLFAPFAPAPYHVKNRREATELLNTIENSTALWIVFYYYAKRQNSRDGQARMRKEVTRSYLSCYKPPSQPASPDGKPLSPATPAPGTPLDPQIETSINTILAALPGAMDHLGEINSTDVSTNGGTGMPSATYNSVTSEKFHILSPVLVLQFLKEFNLLPAHLRTGVNGNGTPASTGAYNYLYSLYVGVTQEAVTFSSRAKHTSPTAPSTTSGAGGAHRTGTVSPGVRSADAAEGADLSDEVQVTMPVGVVATYMNFLMFQKVSTLWSMLLFMLCRFLSCVGFCCMLYYCSVGCNERGCRATIQQACLQELAQGQQRDLQRDTGTNHGGHATAPAGRGHGAHPLATAGQCIRPLYGLGTGRAEKAHPRVAC